MTYDESRKMLPVDARWSASFGFCGEGGYAEYWRCPNGDRWVIGNGPWHAIEPFDWTCDPVHSTSKG